MMLPLPVFQHHKEHTFWHEHAGSGQTQPTIIDLQHTSYNMVL